ncbi:MAG: type IV pilus modification PilV family protein [Candidatus Zipacnadales bacterium]
MPLRAWRRETGASRRCFGQGAVGNRTSALYPLRAAKDDKGGQLRSQGGFTLLEAIVSLAIMGLGLVAVLEAYTASMRLSLQDEYLTTATFLASSKMEEVLKERYFTAGTDKGNFGEDFEDFTWTVEIADSEIEGLEVITVTVHWTVANREDELTLTTARPFSRPEEETGASASGQRGGGA